MKSEMKLYLFDVNKDFLNLETLLEDGETLLELAQEENDLTLIDECREIFVELETQLQQAEIANAAGFVIY